MDAELLLKRHDLLANQALLDFITSRYGELGIHSPPANLKNDELVKYFIGEYYALLTKQLGERAAELLFQARWNAYSHPEWFDHRLSDLSDKYNTDYVALSGVHALLCMPLSGKVLSLCSGDGYYEYHYYSYRADHVDCLEIDADAFSHACIYHKKKNIS
jgi:hypothetical protein